jgi:hypothetical protein
MNPFKSIDATAARSLAGSVHEMMPRVFKQIRDAAIDGKYQTVAYYWEDQLKMCSDHLKELGFDCSNIEHADRDPRGGNGIFRMTVKW